MPDRAEVSTTPPPSETAEFLCANDGCANDTGSPDVYYCGSACQSSAVYRKMVELREGGSAST